MKLAIWYDKKKPTINLVYATTHETDVELTKVILDIDDSVENTLLEIYNQLGVEYKEFVPDCGPDGCEE